MSDDDLLLQLFSLEKDDLLGYLYNNKPFEGQTILENIIPNCPHCFVTVDNYIGADILPSNNLIYVRRYLVLRRILGRYKIKIYSLAASQAVQKSIIDGGLIVSQNDSTIC